MDSELFSSSVINSVLLVDNEANVLELVEKSREESVSSPIDVVLVTFLEVLEESEKVGIEEKKLVKSEKEGR